MKSLILMRHSYAVADNPAFHDRERPLTDRGQDIAMATGALLKDSSISQIICSSAVRTVETARLIAAACHVPETHADDSLYLAAAHKYQNAAADYAKDEDSTILVVGHNPGIASLILSWTESVLPVTPGTVARFEVNVDNWIDLPRADASQSTLSDFISEGKRQTFSRS